MSHITIVLTSLAGGLVAAGLQAQRPTGAAAVKVQCPEGVPQVTQAEDPYGYWPREGRCEGRYAAQRLSGGALQIVGFTQLFDDYPLDARKTLIVEWPATGSPVSIEAVALVPRANYRMDASLPASEQAFAWPLDVLAWLRFGRSEIGVLARTPREVNGRVHQVLVPLRLGTNPVVPGAGYTLRLAYEGEIRTAHVTISLPSLLTLQEGPQPMSQVVPVRAAGAYGYDLTIKRPAEPGVYSIEVAVEGGDGSIDGVRDWFLNGL